MLRGIVVAALFVGGLALGALSVGAAYVLDVLTSVWTAEYAAADDAESGTVVFVVLSILLALAAALQVVRYMRQRRVRAPRHDKPGTDPVSYVNWTPTTSPTDATARREIPYWVGLSAPLVGMITSVAGLVVAVTS